MPPPKISSRPRTPEGSFRMVTFGRETGIVFRDIGMGLVVFGTGGSGAGEFNIVKAQISRRRRPERGPNILKKRLRHLVADEGEQQAEDVGYQNGFATDCFGRRQF